MSVRARIPLTIRHGIVTEMVSFTLKDHGLEDVAVLFPGWETQKNVLVRLHSECLTGDVFGSARCDCGAQLDEAITMMAEKGGILLYLRQEGRGIGLYNKLDAYKLQLEAGKDTFEANIHLGLPADARSYGAAAEMLRDLGVSHVELLTNNPEKARALAESGITVASILPTGLHATSDNMSYLEAKKKSGHTLDVITRPQASRRDQ